jgi:hypothetical protein
MVPPLVAIQHLRSAAARIISGAIAVGPGEQHVVSSNK